MTPDVWSRPSRLAENLFPRQQSLPNTYRCNFPLVDDDCGEFCASRTAEPRFFTSFICLTFFWSLLFRCFNFHLELALTLYFILSVGVMFFEFFPKNSMLRVNYLSASKYGVMSWLLFCTVFPILFTKILLFQSTAKTAWFFHSETRICLTPLLRRQAGK